MKILNKIKNNNLIGATGIYAIAAICNASIPFLLIPVLTRYLTPDDYGLIAMFAALVSFVSSFTGLSIHGAISIQFFKLNREELAVYVYNCLCILIVSSVLTGILFISFSRPISRVSSIPVNWFWAVILLSMLTFITKVLLALWQVQFRSLAYGVFQNFITLTNLTLSLFLVICLDMAWEGRVQAQIINGILFGVLSLWLLYRERWIKFRFDLNYIKNALNFGVPLIPTALKDCVISITDRIFVAHFVGVASTGIYVLGFQFGMVISILNSSFNLAFAPWLFGKLKLNDSNVNIRLVKFTYLYFIIILVVAISWSVIVTVTIDVFVGKDFVGASNYVAWISLAFAFSGMHSMVVNYIYYAEKTKIYGAITVFIGVLNIGLNYVFILRNGAIGAAQATCVTYFFGFILTWILSSRVYSMPWLFFLRR